MDVHQQASAVFEQGGDVVRFLFVKNMSLTVYAMKMDLEVTSWDAGRPGRKDLQWCMKEIVHI